MTKKLAIISRYNEDILWTEKLQADVIIFNKGSDWPWPNISRTDVVNIGYEAETFCRAIINLYEVIPDYETVVFCQGSPFDHCPDVVEIINNADSKTFRGLIDKPNTIVMPKDDIYVRGFPHFAIRRMAQPEWSYPWPFENNYSVHNSLVDMGSDAILLSTMSYIMGINVQDRDFTWYGSGQHIVPVEKILNKSKNWWIDLYRLLYFSIKEYDKGHGAACNFERFWWTIFNHSE